jgi:hypothetical protein
MTTVSASATAASGRRDTTEAVHSTVEARRLARRSRHRVGRLAEAIERGIRRRDPQADHRTELGQVPGPDAAGVETPGAAGRAQVDDRIATDAPP